MDQLPAFTLSKQNLVPLSWMVESNNRYPNTLCHDHIGEQIALQNNAIYLAHRIVLRRYSEAGHNIIEIILFAISILSPNGRV